MCIYEASGWPGFVWDKDIIYNLLSEVRYKQGYLTGKMSNLTDEQKEKDLVKVLSSDLLKSAELEACKLDSEQLNAAIAKRFKIPADKNITVKKDIQSIVDMFLDATQNFEMPLSKERLQNWHSVLQPWSDIETGKYRDDMNGSTPIVMTVNNQEKTLCEAFPAGTISYQVNKLIQYINSSDDGIDVLIKAGVVHLWFFTIYPFDSFNGVIARVLTDMLITRSQKSANRFYSLAAGIADNTTEYYKALEIIKIQSLDITPWLVWFFESLSKAMDVTETTAEPALKKTSFKQKHATTALNPRQSKVLDCVLAGKLDTKLTTTVWAKMTESSQDTATRDIADLIKKKVLIKQGEARATHYIVNIE